MPNAVTFYKYMERQFADQLVNNGTIQIGTLLDFRNMERHTLGVGDPSEGLRTTTIVGNPADTIHVNNIEMPGLTMSSGTFSGNHGSLISYVEQSPQYYILCFSITKERAAMEKMNDKYDTCVEISRPVTFCNLLTEEIEKQYKLKPLHENEKVAIFDCHYIDPVELEITSVDNTSIELSRIPVFLQKLVEFKYQTEARAIWNPDGIIAEKPFIVTSEAAKSLCRIVDI